ncbi:hypothetical protein [Rhodococcus erythropolis]
MTGNEIRAARLRLLSERLATIRSKQRTLFDSLGDSPIPGTRYTEARIAEINQLEFEAKTIEAELKSLERL